MKISTLLKREPFAEIFEKTLTSFLSSWIGTTHKVIWEKRIGYGQNLRSQQKWYCNPLINSVFVKGVNKDVFEPINGEYTANPTKPWRSMIQKIYVTLSQSKLTSLILSKYVVKISPHVPFAENKLIIGGNTKLRLLDVAEKKVFVLLKDGFDKSYIERDFYVRKNFPYLPIPKIIDSGSDGTWFCEELVSGVPPNRLDRAYKEEKLLQAVNCIHQMLIETKRDVILSKYIEALTRRIYEGISQIQHMKKDVKSDLKDITLKLVSLLHGYEDQVFTVAYCHGDFHQGNVLANKDSFWILDWEYSGEKQIGYDLLVLLIESRIEKGFAERFLKIVKNQFDNLQNSLIDNWPELDRENGSIKKVNLVVFLLEDLLFHLNESKNDLFFSNSEILKLRRDELKKIVDNLS
mgnify:CR=1 FL=1